MKRRSVTPQSAHGQHVPLWAIDPSGIAATRSTARVTDIPGKRPTRPITFDSAI
ncbi:hypothetical protein [Streptomyces cylindrosporus]|uniref:Transposase n=1 Tax=Streptomyces cylindrosporus TaxID=2927583 RepID=A0ABS9XY51_9ACTN|nr:hypothetical protein [Streptomyces cylindrosporus]MCI3269893.1 hypothetical protein [Streptomyces cylindrosporus]